MNEEMREALAWAKEALADVADVPLTPEQERSLSVWGQVRSKEKDKKGRGSSAA